MTTINLPELPEHHPDPRKWKWTELEKRAITAYATQAVEQDRAGRAPMTEWEVVKVCAEWNESPGESIAGLMRRVEAFHGISAPPAIASQGDPA